MADTQGEAEGFRAGSGFSVLEDVMPRRDRRFLPDQPEREPEPGGLHPAVAIRLDGNVPAVLQRVDLETYPALAGVRDPELWNARLGVQGRKAFRVLAFGAVADDLHDHVGCPFDLGKAVRLSHSGWNVSDSPALQRVPQDDHHIRFDGKLREPGGHPCPVDVGLAEPSRDQKMQCRMDGCLDDTVGVQILRAHGDCDLSAQVVDAPVLRELFGLRPSLEALQGRGFLGNPEVLFSDDRVSSGHDGFYLLMPSYGSRGLGTGLARILRALPSAKRGCETWVGASATVGGVIATMVEEGAAALRPHWWRTRARHGVRSVLPGFRKPIAERRASNA